MKDIEFDVKLGTKELYAFSMRHAYASMSGVFGLIISVGSLAIFAVGHKSYDMTTNMALIIVGLIFTVLQPIVLLAKCAKQAKQSKDVNEALHYKLSDRGITVEQGEAQAQVKWFEVRRKVKTSKALYLYMSPIRAFIFPKEQCGEEYDSTVSLVTAMMEKYKDYDPDEDSAEEYGQPEEREEAQMTGKDDNRQEEE